MKTKTNTKKRQIQIQRRRQRQRQRQMCTLSSHHLNLYFGFAPYSYLKLSFYDQIGVQLPVVFSVLYFQKIFRNAQTNKTCKSNHLNNGQSHFVSTDTVVRGNFSPTAKPSTHLQEKRTKFCGFAANKFGSN